jgi:hypothetical protein
MSDQIQIKLSKAEALLVFEALAKIEEKKLLDVHVSEEERSACWALEAALEKELPVFAPNYAELIEQAKRTLKGEEPIQPPQTTTGSSAPDRV